MKVKIALISLVFFAPTINGEPTLQLIQYNDYTSDTTGCISIPDYETFVFSYQANLIRKNQRGQYITDITTSYVPTSMVTISNQPGLFVVGGQGPKLGYRSINDPDYHVDQTLDIDTDTTEPLFMVHIDDTIYIFVAFSTRKVRRVLLTSLYGFKVAGDFSMSSWDPNMLGLVHKPTTHYIYLLTDQTNKEIQVHDTSNMTSLGNYSVLSLKMVIATFLTVDKIFLSHPDNRLTRRLPDFTVDVEQDALSGTFVSFGEIKGVE